MGSRGRSIRLRIYFLVAIPLITMLGLFGYVAYTSVSNWLNLDRSPGLIEGTSVPITRFVSLLQAERRAAVVYLSNPDTANANTYQASVTATKAGEVPLEAALNSPGTKSSANAQENAAITTWVGEVNGMAGLRAGVAGAKLPAVDAFAAYTKIVTDQDSVFEAAASSLTDTFASSQGLGLIATVNSREDLDEQDAALAGALAGGSLTPAERVAFAQAAGRQQDDTALYSALLTPAELSDFNAQVGTPAVKALSTELTTVQQAVEGGATLREVEQSGLSPAAWQKLTSTVAAANYQGGLAAASDDLVNVQQQVNNAKDRVWATAIIGAAGLILTLVVSLLLSRSINRRLTTLRRSALTLAQEQLPSVVARLRRGESVDVAAEAPPMRVGSDEIGQVGQAIDTVRQTAIRSAIDEARVRQGVNDMFRNLARRNQSLLQRQLTVLDDMERQATDPDVLEDLFKMDHLTTRMRRHAEGLIILSGSPPGRSWSAPVKLIDVMRGAVAEVEDYARVTVSSQSRAALAGSAVTDVIHLLAELIENATTLSPPFTQVRVNGETVASGFAIEIEDRGLGMAPERLHELNERLSNPPALNPANTEQLGLFVVGQLARRHGIRVMLRPSPYGGTTAVALLPATLIVEEGPAAITSGGQAPAGAAGDGYPGAAAPSGYPDGVPVPAQYPDRTAIPSGYANGSTANGYAGGPAGPGLGGDGYAGPAAYGNGTPPASGRGSRAPADGQGVTDDSAGLLAPRADPNGRPAYAPSKPAQASGNRYAPPAEVTAGYPGDRPAAEAPFEPAAPAAFGASAFTAGPSAATDPGQSPEWPDPADLPRRRASGRGNGAQNQGRPAISAAGPFGQSPGAHGLAQPGRPEGPAGSGAPAAFGGPSGFGAPGRPSLPAAPGAAGQAGPGAGGAGRGPRGANTEEVPVVTGVPVSRPTPPPMPAFDVFSPARRAEQDEAPAQTREPYASAYPDFGQPGRGAAAASPYPGMQPPSGYESGSGYQNGADQNNGYRDGAYQNGVATPAGNSANQGQVAFQDDSTYPGNDRTQPEDVGYGGVRGYAGDGAYGNEGSTGNHGESNGDGTGWESGGGDHAGDDDEYKGLPRRVRQANLAPQLRASATAAGASGASVPPATAASLTDMRNTLSAMQRGWRQGRSQTQRDMEGEVDGN